MESPALEVLIVTGPLGSGKTTVVNRLLKREIAEKRKVAVLINEFGTVSVDGTLVDAERPELAGVANLVNGCVCCSLRGDVIAALAAWCDLPLDVRPERVVLETTGLADPTDLVDLEAEAPLAGRMKLAGCLTVISCLTPLDLLVQRPLLRHQAALASLVYVSKADLDPSLAVAWESQLRSAFQGLSLVHSRLGEVPTGSPDPWRGDLPALPSDHVHLNKYSFAETRSLALHWDHPVDPAALEALFQDRPAQGELLRAKGIASFDGWPPRNDGSDRWAFQVADGRTEILPLAPLSSGELAARVAVVIGTGLDLHQWKRRLRELERPPAGARRKVVLG
jgi:G3E family GTPase